MCRFSEPSTTYLHVEKRSDLYISNLCRVTHLSEREWRSLHRIVPTEKKNTVGFQIAKTLIKRLFHIRQIVEAKSNNSVNNYQIKILLSEIARKLVQIAHNMALSSILHLLLIWLYCPKLVSLEYLSIFMSVPFTSDKQDSLTNGSGSKRRENNLFQNDSILGCQS